MKYNEVKKVRLQLQRIMAQTEKTDHRVYNYARQAMVVCNRAERRDKQAKK